jgi:GntP family gluconate:H+ symporter
MISGPFFGRVISRRVQVQAGSVADQLSGSTTARRAPSLAITLVTILLPVLLMLLAALVQSIAAEGPARSWIAFAGSPLVAMLLATLLAFYTFGTSCGFDRAHLLRAAEEAVPAVANVLLVVGAGGGFGRVLDAAGVDTAIAQVMSGRSLSPIVLGWSIAAMLRLSVGSATVAVVTAASIMAPIIEALPGVNRDLMVVAIGAGSLIASHVNDGGFWLVKEYFNMSVAQTVATWTVLETIIAVAGLAGALALGLVLR